MWLIFYPLSIVKQEKSMPKSLWTFWNRVSVKIRQEITFSRRFLFASIHFTEPQRFHTLACFGLLPSVVLPPTGQKMSPKPPGCESVKPNGDAFKDFRQSSCRNITWSSDDSPALIGHFLGKSHLVIAYWTHLGWNDCQPSVKHCVQYQWAQNDNAWFWP